MKEAIKNAVFAAIAKWSDKQFDRDLLAAGEYNTTVTVLAKSGRHTIEETATLSLTVGSTETQSKSVKLKADEVLALALDVCGPAAKGRILTAIESRQKPSDDNVKVAALAIKSNAKTVKKSVRGAVTLSVD